LPVIDRLHQMILFVIHRSKDKNTAKATLKEFAQKLSLELYPIFLNSNLEDEKWKNKAVNAIDKAEAVIIFNKPFCEESNNATWEIEKAKESGKDIIEINVNGYDRASADKLKSIYDLKDEFNACFKSKNKDTLELYKLMIDSSESLIQRRQKTNAFFITAIGSLLAIAGFLVKTGVINSGTFGILYGFPIVSILLCISWYNLIDNYGKLNKAKFDVILRLEQQLGAQIYSAEWVALGKGMRPKKYKSFTSTEKNVPLYFILLIVVLTIITVVLQIFGQRLYSTDIDLPKNEKIIVAKAYSWRIKPRTEQVNSFNYTAKSSKCIPNDVYQHHVSGNAYPKAN